MRLLSDSPRPTFIGIGGHKCASTWLSECLRYHPQVFMSSPKEVHYFDNPQHLAQGGAWYLRHFERAVGYQAVGEFTATYLAGVVSVPRMREMLGDVQIVVSLREPVSRFLSQYKHYIRRGHLPKAAFQHLDERALQHAIQRCPTLLTYGQYYRHLVQYYDVFGAENILVILKDDVDADPAGVLVRLFEFLGVDATHRSPVLEKRVSPGIVPRYPLLETCRQKMFAVARDHAPRIIDVVRRSGLAEVYRSFNRESAGGELVVAEHVRRRLYDMHLEEIELCESLIGRSLASWRKTAASREAA